MHVREELRRVGLDLSERERRSRVSRGVGDEDSGDEIGALDAAEGSASAELVERGVPGRVGEGDSGRSVFAKWEKTEEGQFSEWRGM